MSELLFSAYLEKAVFDHIMTRFFQTVGYIEPNMELEFEDVEILETEFGPRVNFSAGMKENTVQ